MELCEQCGKEMSKSYRSRHFKRVHPIVWKAINSIKNTKEATKSVGDAILNALLSEAIGKRPLIAVGRDFSDKTGIPFDEVWKKMKKWYAQYSDPEGFKLAKLKAKLRSQLSPKWRRQIFKRDGYKCRICGFHKNLELAHITSLKEFLKAKLEIANSYREDNLVTLCHWCHIAQDRFASKSDPDNILQELTKVKKILGQEPVVKQYLELNRELMILEYPDKRITQIIEEEIKLKKDKKVSKYLRVQKAIAERRKKITEDKRDKIVALFEQLKAERRWKRPTKLAKIITSSVGQANE